MCTSKGSPAPKRPRTSLMSILSLPPSFQQLWHPLARNVPTLLEGEGGFLIMPAGLPSNMHPACIFFHLSPSKSSYLSPSKSSGTKSQVAGEHPKSRCQFVRVVKGGLKIHCTARKCAWTRTP